MSGSLPPDRIERAAALLFDCWQKSERIAALPNDLRPATRAEGYAIQAHLDARSAAPLYGWKIAATSAAGQAHIAVDGPLAGRLLAERVIPDDAACPFGANQMQVAEIEFAFRIGDTLPPRASPYAVDEVMVAVAGLHPAIEIPDSRLQPFERAGAPQLIADNACANYFIAGPAAPESWRDIDLSTYPTSGRINDGALHHGSGGNVLGDPRFALTWLANELSGLGIPLCAGQIVTTGTSIIPMPIAPGDRITGDLGPIGTISLTMARS
jgi:2-keto-4-pentenoate hydratase